VSILSWVYVFRADIKLPFFYSTQAIKECLDHLHNIPKDLEDHDRITSLITCGNFDVFLDIGML